MLKTGHYGAALLLYAPVGFLLLSVDPALAVLGGVGSVTLARLPDYDLLVSFVQHRGATHTLAFLAVVAAALGWLGHVFAGQFGTASTRTAGLGVAVAGVAVGSHLLADALTPSGVPLLWPLSRRRFSVPLTTAGNPVANYGLLAVGLVATLAVGYLAGRA
jgi:inner membrane protein